MARFSSAQVTLQTLPATGRPSLQHLQPAIVNLPADFETIKIDPARHKLPVTIFAIPALLMHARAHFLINQRSYQLASDAKNAQAYVVGVFHAESDRRRRIEGVGIGGYFRPVHRGLRSFGNISAALFGQAEG